MKRQWQLLRTAIMFYTRIPVGGGPGHGLGDLSAATAYFPLVGWLVGGLGGLVFAGAHYFYGTDTALVLSMICQVLVTGALHEDGLADTCDGFGGGWTREKILAIMKDSRSGAFGVIGLILAFLLKFSLLRALPVGQLPWALIGAHAASRWSSALVIAFGHYARDDEGAKARPVAKGLSGWQLAGATLAGLFPLVALKPAWVLPVVAVLLVTTYLLYRYFRKWIGGYTGDCLGTVQQVTEIIFYSLLPLLWRFIS